MDSQGWFPPCVYCRIHPRGESDRLCTACRFHLGDRWTEARLDDDARRAARLDDDTQWEREQEELEIARLGEFAAAVVIPDAVRSLQAKADRFREARSLGRLLTSRGHRVTIRHGNTVCEPPPPAELRAAWEEYKDTVGDVIECLRADTATR